MSVCESSAQASRLSLSQETETLGRRLKAMAVIGAGGCIYRTPAKKGNGLLMQQDDPLTRFPGHSSVCLACGRALLALTSMASTSPRLVLQEQAGQQRDARAPLTTAEKDAAAPSKHPRPPQPLGRRPHPHRLAGGRQHDPPTTIASHGSKRHVSGIGCHGGSLF